MTAVSIMGPVGAPMKKPYGSFSGKPMQVVIYSVMGPQGAPMKQPYGGFTGAGRGGAAGTKFFTVSGLQVSNNNPAFCFTGGVSYTWSAMSQRTK